MVRSADPERTNRKQMGFYSPTVRAGIPVRGGRHWDEGRMTRRAEMDTGVRGR